MQGPAPSLRGVQYGNTRGEMWDFVCATSFTGCATLADAARRFGASGEGSAASEDGYGGQDGHSLRRRLNMWRSCQRPNRNSAWRMVPS
jgi:hypothetical protein